MSSHERGYSTADPEVTGSTAVETGGAENPAYEAIPAVALETDVWDIHTFKAHYPAKKCIRIVEMGVALVIPILRLEVGPPRVPKALLVQ